MWADLIDGPQGGGHRPLWNTQDLLFFIVGKLMLHYIFIMPYIPVYYHTVYIM